MEDSHTVRLQLDDDKQNSFFAVYDGHGGQLYLSSKYSQQPLMMISYLSSFRCESSEIRRAEFIQATGSGAGLS
jgi:hypothetical protein